MNTFVILVKLKSKPHTHCPPSLCSYSYRWIENCLQDEIDPIIKLEETMRNGIILARLANWFAPGTARKIFQVIKKLKEEYVNLT